MTREEALKVANEMHQWVKTDREKEALETLIPELKESEDERIIKTLQEYVKNRNWALNGPTQAEVLAWLEKQKNLISYYEEKLDRCACENLDKGIKEVLNHPEEYGLEKQKEQNPVETETIISCNGHCEECSCFNAGRKYEQEENNSAECSEDYREEDACEQKPAEHGKDERIRKKLIEYFSHYKEDREWWEGITPRDIISYLELQKPSFRQIHDSVMWDNGLRTGIELGKQKEHIPYTDFVIKPHKGDNTNPYDMSASEAQEYTIKRGFGIPFNDGEVYIDERHMTQTIGNILRWADEHPKEQKPTAKINGEPISTENQTVKVGDDETEVQKAYREGKNAGRKEVFDHPEEYGLQLRRMYDYETGRKNPEWSEEDKEWLSEVYYAIDNSMYSDCEKRGMKKYINSLRNNRKTSDVDGFNPKPGDKFWVRCKVGKDENLWFDKGDERPAYTIDNGFGGLTYLVYLRKDGRGNRIAYPDKEGFLGDFEIIKNI